MKITLEMAWLRSRDETGDLPPPPAGVDTEKLERNGWCRRMGGKWIVTEAAAWALGQGETVKN